MLFHFKAHMRVVAFFLLVLTVIAAFGTGCQQREKQADLQSFYSETFYTFALCVTALQDFVRQHPEALKKFLRALIRAEAFAKQYPKESQRLVAKFVKTDEAFPDEIWDVYNHRVTLDQALLVDLEDQTRWAIKNRLTVRRDMPNYLDFIDVDSLRAVKPEAVRIIR
jgi:NitT/TauT family transport system substrate-binding protein